MFMKYSNLDSSNVNEQTSFLRSNLIRRDFQMAWKGNVLMLFNYI